jgi:hypothetical protein
MKLKSILLSLVLLSSGAASAATLVASTADTGLTLSNGTTAMSSGALRFGFFAAGFDFATNANDIAALEAAFTQVASYTGPISDSGFDGFFNYSTVYNTASAFEGVQYDLSSGTTNNVANDVAGEKIYLWAMDNSVATSATQHAIFSSNQVWTDADTAFNNDSGFTFDSGTAGLTAHIGTLGGGADIGGGNASHSLANIAAVPEPSRALLGMVGLGALVFRRRRRA